MIPTCTSCGDDAKIGGMYRGKLKCAECWNELVKGIVRNQNIDFFSNGAGVHDDRPYPDDFSRHKEDMR